MRQDLRGLTDLVKLSIRNKYIMNVHLNTSLQCMDIFFTLNHVYDLKLPIIDLELYIKNEFYD